MRLPQIRMLGLSFRWLRLMSRRRWYLRPSYGVLDAVWEAFVKGRFELQEVYGGIDVRPRWSGTLVKMFSARLTGELLYLPLTPKRPRPSD